MLTPLAISAFLCFGLCLVLVGANQRELAAALELNLESSAALAAAMSLGLGLGVTLSGPAADRWPRRPLFITAGAVAAGALLSVNTEMEYAGMLLRMGLLGLGVGTWETILNTSLSERDGERAPRTLAIVHSAATIGAVLAPPLALASTTHFAWTTSFQATGFACLAVSCLATCTPFGTPVHQRGKYVPRSSLWPAILPYAIAASCYVGIETTLTVLAPSWAVDGHRLLDVRGASTLSSFWFGLLAGRLGFLLYPGTQGPRLLTIAGFAGAITLALAHLLPAELAAGLIGLSLGFVFPLTVALVALRFPNAPGTATGIVVGTASLGGIAIPWATGWLSDQLGVLAGVGTLAIWCVVLALASQAILHAPPAQSHTP